jgi:hypothetical protein
LIARIAEAAPGVLIDLLGLAGFAAVTYGAWQFSEPVGWIVGGVLAVAAALLLSWGR